MDNEYLINYEYSENSGQKIWNQLSKSVDELLENPGIISERLIKGFNEHLARSNQNHIILKEFLIKGEWDVGN